MGASSFCEFHAGTNLKQVFKYAVEDAQTEYGSRGGTGSIAEKYDVVLIDTVDTKVEANRLADNLVEEGDKRIDDKYGPAGAIAVRGPVAGFVFFGWANG